MSSRYALKTQMRLRFLRPAGAGGSAAFLRPRDPFRELGRSGGLQPSSAFLLLRPMARITGKLQPVRGQLEVE